MKSFPSRLPADPSLFDMDESPGGDTARVVLEVLRGGGCPSDTDFDRQLTPDERRVSGWFWTPVAVARRAADWLFELGARSVMDVGSGAGKFCVVVAATTDLCVVGLEHRPNLVVAARALARRYGLSAQVAFVEGALGQVPLPSVDAYYFFNPFGENLYGSSDCLDENVVLTRERYRADLAATTALLERAPVGTLIVTYNGIGADLPAAYALRRVDRELPCLLKLYEKTQLFTDTSRHSLGDATPPA